MSPTRGQPDAGRIRSKHIASNSLGALSRVGCVAWLYRSGLALNEHQLLSHRTRRVWYGQWSYATIESNSVNCLVKFSVSQFSIH